MDISTIIAIPSQKALKFPATRPEDVERRSTLARRRHHFGDVARLGRREDLHELRNDRSRKRAARDDRRELPPERGITTDIGDQEERDDKRQRYGDQRSQPDE